MRSLESEQARGDAVNEIDLRGIGIAVRRRKKTVAIVVLAAFIATAIFVSVTTPVYTATAQLLLENQETFFTRPDRVNLQPDASVQFDAEAVASQIQLIESRDIARRAIADLHLEGNPEFDPQARGLNALRRVLVLVGLMRDPTRESVDQRIVTAFLTKLTVFSPPKTRVISIEFTSRDSELAARAANMIATLYIREQSSAKRITAKESADALAGQIADLRSRLSAADAEKEQYRSQTGLLTGSNNMTISAQQLADINTDLSKARTAQADAQAKASMIRELIRSGKAADVTDVVNNETVRRVADQRVSAEAQLALESRTLLPGHPRIKALTAQMQEYDLALKNAGRQAATTLENEAKIAGSRVSNLEIVLSQQKKDAGVANVDEVHLAALERAAQSYKDQLESSTTKYQEALARESSTATPADARIISRAVPPQEASYPKKLPIIAFGTIGSLVFVVGIIIAAELLSGDALQPVGPTSGPLRETTIDMGPIKAPRPKPRRSPDRMPQEVIEESDLVFAPVVRTSPATRASTARDARYDGMLNSLRRRIMAFGESAVASRAATIDALPPQAVEPNRADRPALVVEARPTVQADLPDPTRHLRATMGRIVDAHVPGRGVHVVGTSLGSERAATQAIIDLSRMLSEKGRAIIVDLNRSPVKLSVLAKAEDDGRAQIMGMDGLSELLAGEASFAEVIYRDHGSRLHFIPSGRQEADFRDFDLILDALSETYDFIVMLTPAFPQSEIAKIMAPYADFVVMSADSEPDPKMLAILESELLEAGARAVLLANSELSGRGQDVA